MNQITPHEAWSRSCSGVPLPCTQTRRGSRCVASFCAVRDLRLVKAVRRTPAWPRAISTPPRPCGRDVTVTVRVWVAPSPDAAKVRDVQHGSPRARLRVLIRRVRERTQRHRARTQGTRSAATPAALRACANARQAVRPAADASAQNGPSGRVTLSQGAARCAQAGIVPAVLPLSALSTHARRARPRSRPRARRSPPHRIAQCRARTVARNTLSLRRTSQLASAASGRGGRANATHGREARQRRHRCEATAHDSRDDHTHTGQDDRRPPASVRPVQPPMGPPRPPPHRPAPPSHTLLPARQPSGAATLPGLQCYRPWRASPPPAASDAPRCLVAHVQQLVVDDTTCLSRPRMAPAASPAALRGPGRMCPCGLGCRRAHSVRHSVRHRSQVFA